MSQLSRYELLEEIGRGNMGVVYRARDPKIGRTVAIKLVSLGFRPDAAQKEAFLARFEREAKIVGRLAHPHIAAVYDVELGDEPFIVMEHVEGVSLASVLQKRRLGLDEVSTITAQLASALGYAHRLGVVHRDIKPANVLYRSGPEIKLVDFGIAKMEAPGLTATGEFIGTPSYMSPETFAGDAIDGRSDLFSLGVILYQLLTGERPFEAESVSQTIYRVLHTEPVKPSERNPELGSEWDYVCRKLIAKDPGERYPHAEALSADLDAMARGSFVVPDPTAATTPITTSMFASHRRRWILGGALLFVLLAFFGRGTLETGDAEAPPRESSADADAGALLESAERAIERGELDQGAQLLDAYEAHVPEGGERLAALADNLERERFLTSLPFRFVARHEHRIGHCTGDLVLGAREVRYESSRHAWSWRVDAIQVLERVNGERLSIEAPDEDGELKDYELTFLRPSLAQSDFERYRASVLGRP